MSAVCCEKGVFALKLVMFAYKKQMALVVLVKPSYLNRKEVNVSTPAISSVLCGFFLRAK